MSSIPPQSGASSPTLLNDLRAEVSAETAPLLLFLQRHAGRIAGCVGLFLLVLIGAGIWSWRNEAAREEAQAELARISLSLKGEERTKALGELAKTAPESVRYAVLAAQARSAEESQDWTQAARIYGEAARLDSEGTLGQTALLAQCGALMRSGSPESASEALAVLQSLSGRVEGASRPALLRMQAEAALAAGRNDVAAAAFRALGEEARDEDKAYYLARAAQLEGAPAGAGQASDKSPDKAPDKASDKAPDKASDKAAGPAE